MTLYHRKYIPPVACISDTEYCQFIVGLGNSKYYCRHYGKKEGILENIDDVVAKHEKCNKDALTC